MRKQSYRRMYHIQRNNARRRGISWKITYIQWRSIWARSGHWHERGRGLGEYVMARFGDKGPYAPNNVKIILATENLLEANIGNTHNLGKTLSLEARAKMSVARMGNQNLLGHKHSAETRQKISKAGRGRKHSIETRHKLSIAGRRENLSKETLRKRSEAAKGRRHSVGTRRKISEAHQGKKLSVEHKRKLSKAMIGNTNGLGSNLSAETRAKMSVARKAYLSSLLSKPAVIERV